ncbi:MAG: hypothetical protein LBT30_07565 [Clostridiales bacterium]|nr:hypothetical protein [Clostridiales bacterium]
MRKKDVVIFNGSLSVLEHYGDCYGEIDNSHDGVPKSYLRRIYRHLSKNEIKDLKVSLKEVHLNNNSVFIKSNYERYLKRQRFFKNFFSLFHKKINKKDVSKK